MDASQRTSVSTDGAGARARGGLAWVLYVAFIAQLVATILVWMLVHRWVPGAAPNDEWGGAFLIGMPFATLGVIVARRRPEQRLGWIFLAIGLAEAAMLITRESAAAAFDLHGVSVSVAAASWVSALFEWSVLGGLLAVLVLFPTGRPTSRWSRYVLWLITAGVVCGWIDRSFPPADQVMVPGVGNPFGFGAAPRPVRWVVEAGLVLFLFGAVGAIVSLMVRFARARGVERQQLKVFLYAVAVGIAFWSSPFYLRFQPVSAWLETQLVTDLRWTLLPVAPAVGIGVALLRHGLYDIDRIISRTVVYTAVTTVIGLGYSGVVLVSGELLGSNEDLPTWVIATTTLAAAAVFRPVRQLIQTRVERHFNRPRYDMRRTIDDFSARVKGGVALDTLHDELVAVVNKTMQPESTAVWLATSSHVHPSTGMPMTRTQHR